MTSDRHLEWDTRPSFFSIDDGDGEGSSETLFRYPRFAKVTLLSSSILRRIYTGNIPRSLSNLNIDFACLENYSRWFNRRERSHMLFFLFFFFKYIVIIYLINLRNSEWSKVCFEDWTWFWSFFIEKSLDIRLEHAHSKSVVISNLFKDFSNYLIKRRVSKFNIIYINFIVFYCLWSTNDLAKSFMYYGNVKQWYR